MVSSCISPIIFCSSHTYRVFVFLPSNATDVRCLPSRQNAFFPLLEISYECAPLTLPTTLLIAKQRNSTDTPFQFPPLTCLNGVIKEHEDALSVSESQIEREVPSCWEPWEIQRMHKKRIPCAMHLYAWATTTSHTQTRYSLARRSSNSNNCLLERRIPVATSEYHGLRICTSSAPLSHKTKSSPHRSQPQKRRKWTKP